LETAPDKVDAAAYTPDYIYTWKLPQRAFAGYDLIAGDGDARLFARHAR
jgi:hypothetical protein